jgi:hypothetical protein
MTATDLALVWDTEKSYQISKHQANLAPLTVLERGEQLEMHKTCRLATFPVCRLRLQIPMGRGWVLVWATGKEQ